MSLGPQQSWKRAGGAAAPNLQAGSEGPQGRAAIPNPVLSTTRDFLIYWLPVLCWMAIIFSASSDRGSFQHTSRIIAPVLRWLVPDISESTVHLVVVLVRKAGHLSEYAVLGLLVWRLLARPAANPTRQWRWPDAQRALLVVLLYAASDEFHQRFVPTRQASVWDVLLDTVGGFSALLLLWIIGRWRRRW